MNSARSPVLVLVLSTGLMVGISQGVWAQTPSPTTAPVPQDAAGEDADPTRPVVWSLREEYYNLRSDAWTNVLIFRSDRAFFQNKPRLGGKRGWLTRFDMPLAVSHRQDVIRAGLGDLYAQVLYVPHLTRKFALVAGTGFSLPTATDETLGTGKLIVAPVVIPVWFFEKKGFFLFKLQDFVSVAGDDQRPDLHYFTATPALVWRVKKKWWIQPDTEFKIDIMNSGHTSGRSGFLVGRMVRGRLGISFKPEVYWGRYREGDFVMRVTLFKAK